MPRSATTGASSSAPVKHSRSVLPGKAVLTIDAIGSAHLLVEDFLELVADHGEVRHPLGIAHGIGAILLPADRFERARDRHRECGRITQELLDLNCVLGETGRNFGAGMTNGVAYVLDETGEFPRRLNDELVQATRLMDADELATVYELVREHFERTASRRAEAVLDVWDVYRGQFWKVAPRQASLAAEAMEKPHSASAWARYG